MKTNFNINLEKYSALTAFAIVSVLFLAAFAAVVGWTIYYWYVVAYGFNHVISPLFNIPQISVWVAGGLSVLVGMFFSDFRHKLNKTHEVSWTFLLAPFIAHALLWLLVG